jgi:hypothetical protein
MVAKNYRSLGNRILCYRSLFCLKKERKMKKFMVVLSAVLLVFGMIGIVNADLIDFESTGLSEFDPITSEISGLTFMNAIIAEEGSPKSAWGIDSGGADSTLAGEPFGGFFITDPLVDGSIAISGTIGISFDTPVFDLSFYVADLDNWQDNGGLEVLTAQAFDASSALLQTITITAGDPGTGDAIATLVQFSESDITRLEIIAANQNNLAGWGIDNLEFTTPSSIPDPSVVFLLGSASLVGFAGLRRRFKK